MGLMDFKVAPDNKGGRKKKENSDDSKREYHGNPADSGWGEDEWNEVYNRFVGDGELTPEVMGEMCHFTHLLESSVKFKLTDHGVHEFEEVKKKYPVHFGLQLPSKGSGTQKERSSGEGLFSVVQDAKK